MLTIDGEALATDVPELALLNSFAA